VHTSITSSESFRAQPTSSILSLGSLTTTVWGGEGALNATRFAFEDCVESAVAETPLSSLESIRETNPPMPAPMPIRGHSQSVAVGLAFPFVFCRRSGTGPVASRTLSGNAVGGEIRHEGSNPSRSAFPLADKVFGRLTLQNVASKPTLEGLI
jgi:hypothetical protein